MFVHDAKSLTVLQVNEIRDVIDSTLIGMLDAYFEYAVNSMLICLCCKLAS